MLALDTQQPQRFAAHWNMHVNFTSKSSSVRCSFYFIAMLLFFHGCAAGQSISEEAVENKLSKIKLGSTTKEEIEAIFGKPQTSENVTWTYSLSDTSLVVSQQPYGSWAKSLPLSVMTVPTNTRALITIRFDGNQRVINLEVQRFFNTPFVNDYFYVLDRGTDELELAARIAELSNFRLSSFDKLSGKLVAETGAENAQILVEFKKPILHVTSINPYDRLSTDYRVFIKRETQFIERIFDSTKSSGPSYLSF